MRGQSENRFFPNSDERKAKRCVKRLWKKLKDQCGASILLALLFFLLCSMVGASVLMAAVSNAGKIRSNREEQQKYLLLSSALRLVCDELTSAEYYGQYTYETWIEKKTIDHADDGTPITPPVIQTHTYHRYTQDAGDFQCGLKEVLPLTQELDLIFASRFPPTYDNGTIHYIYNKKGGSFVAVTREMVLEVDTAEVDGLDGSENRVTVKVQMDQDLRIRLTATLGEVKDGYIYTMEAQLTGQGQLGVAGSDSAVVGGNRSGPVTWTLEWIAKKEAGDGA